MRIIGKTKIELTDVKTGKKEVFEDKNTFMSANIEKKFRNFGIFQTSVLENYNATQLWKKLCGGILLLDTAVTPGNNFVDIGTKQVGRGYYGSSNNGSPVSLGSWNSTESAVTTNSIQMVYDFTTSQGNGNINSVCLTSDWCGRIGIGNSADDYNTNYLIDVAGWQNYNVNFNTNISNISNGYAFDGDYLYYNPVVSGTSLTLTKKYANAQTVDLIHYLEDNYTAGTETITLDNAMTHTSNLRLIQFSNTRFALVGYTDEYTNAISVADINLSTLTATVYEISNIPTLSSNLAKYSYSFIEPIGIDSNSHIHIAIPTYEYVATAFAVDVTDGSIVTFKDANRTSSSYQLYSSCQHLGNGLFMYSFGTNANYSYVCDYDAETMYPCEGFTNGNRTFGGIDLVSYNASSYIRFAQNPFYLATINNLDSQITKTSSKTMKVTYTLTRA